MRNIIGAVLIIAMFGYTLFAIFQMPETIPIHFTKGEADGWGVNGPVYFFQESL